MLTCERCGQSRPLFPIIVKRHDVELVMADICRDCWRWVEDFFEFKKAAHASE